MSPQLDPADKVTVHLPVQQIPAFWLVLAVFALIAVMVGLGLSVGKMSVRDLIKSDLTAAERAITIGTLKAW